MDTDVRDAAKSTVIGFFVTKFENPFVRRANFQLLGILCEDLESDPITVKRSRSARVRFQMNEELYNLLFTHPSVQGDSQLPSKWLQRAKRRRN
jgi:hypothetical protein